MAPKVTAGATLTCTQGAGSLTLNVLPNGKFVNNSPVATIDDCKPGVNIIPQCICNSQANPANHKGPVFVPSPCTGPTTGCWLIGDPTNLVDGKPVLTSDSKYVCPFGGAVSIAAPGNSGTVNTNG